MDMMRPVTVHVPRALAKAPVLTTTAGVLNWTDGTPVDYTTPSTWTNPGTAEVGYRIERATVTNGVTSSYAVVGKALANQTSYTDTTGAARTSYAYRVVAFNAAGDSVSNIVIPPAVLSGTVTANGVAVPNATVAAYNSAGVYVAGVLTNASGAYTLSLAPASYKLYVTSAVTGYASQWYGGTSFAAATTVAVAGATTRNIALQLMSGVSGVVTANGAAVPNATVAAYTAAGAYVTGVVTSASGAYTLPLAPASYKLYITSAVTGYASQWYGGTSSATATTVAVAGATTRNIALHPAYVLSGVVTANGAAVPNATVAAYNTAGAYVAGVLTNASGAYTVPLAPASYKLYVTSAVTGYTTQWYGGTSF